MAKKTNYRTAANDHADIDPRYEAFKDQVRDLEERGYIPMPLADTLGSAYNPADPSWSGIINTHFSGACCNPLNPTSGRGMAGLVRSNGMEMPVSDCGDKDLGYIQWGEGNYLPNMIDMWTKLLPYTATSHKHLSELATGLGPQPKFRFFSNAGGTVKCDTIDYAAGGEWLQMTIAQKTNELMQLMAQQSSPASVSGVSPSVNNAATAKLLADLIEQKTKEIEDLKADLEVWRTTNEKVTTFLERTNLQQLTLSYMQELTMFGWTAPELELSQDGTNQPDNAQWAPEIVSLSYRPIMSCRLERRNKEGKIRNMYVSNSWLSDRLPEDYELRITSLPMLDGQHPLFDLRSRLRDWRLNNAKGSFRSRPTRWVMPCMYPSVGQNYYPYMAWWSIFEGDIYPYLATIISDRKTRKDNSNSVGRIVYIHTEYLDALNKETDAKKRIEKADQLRDTIFAQTTRFLQDKTKNGGTMLSFTFPDSRGNLTKAIEIVDVPYTSKNSAEAEKVELAEVSSIVFFAMGIHPEIIGSIPGSAASKGGTYMREMLLIDEVTSASILQQMYLHTFRTIQGFNGWDAKHLVWEVPHKTLTTLDASKSGVVEE